MPFRYKKGICVSYLRQGFIYFTMKNLHLLPEAKREKLKRLCDEAAGEHSAALWAYLTTEKGYVAVCREFYLSQETLFRAQKRFYEKFPERL